MTLSPENATALEELREQRRLSIPIAVDAGNEVSARYGLRHGFSDALREVYLSLGIDLAEANGDASWTLPIPARFLINTDGIVCAVSADPDYTRRPEPEEILQSLDALN